MSYLISTAQGILVASSTTSNIHIQWYYNYCIQKMDNNYYVYYMEQFKTRSDRTLYSGTWYNLLISHTLLCAAQVSHAHFLTPKVPYLV